MQIVIEELTTKNSMLETYKLVSQHYKKIDYSSFETTIDEMIMRNDYKMIAIMQDNEILAVAGYWVSRMFYCGRYLQIHNLIVDENYRSQGLGTKIIRYLEEKARSLNCQKIVLDSHTENKKSHCLYYNENFYIRGFHFMKDL